LKAYLRERPLFLSLLRAKEAYLYRKYLPLARPSMDFGCGDGFFAGVAIGKNKIDLGLDVKESRIGEAIREGIYKKTVIYEGLTIPFEKKSITTLVSNSVLEHVSDLDRVIFEISRVVAPGGKVLTTVMTRKWEDYLLGTKIIGKSYQNILRKKQVHVNLLTRKEWDRKFEKNGFLIKKCIGHMDRTFCRFVEVFHYLSIPSLISFKVFNKWVLFSQLADFLYPRMFLTGIISKDVNPDESGALFYELLRK